MSDTELDAVDRGILYLLQQDARRTITEMADVVNVSDNTVRNRIGRLEREGVIEGYTADVDFNRAGDQHHYQFICTAPVSVREDVANELLDVSGVIEVRTLMTGTRNVFVTAVAATTDEITDIARTIDGYDDVQIELEDLIRLHVRQPLESFAIENVL
jgi:DNA-binding Lrp family transcriptional regulator